jgi:nitrite reductase (NADH) small subunit
VIAVLASVDLPEGRRTVIVIEGHALALVRVEGQVHAMANRCPHRGGSLGHGDLAGHHLYCPLHAWCFDVRTGEGFFPKGARIAIHKTREEGGQIFVDPLPQPRAIDFVPPVG